MKRVLAAIWQCAWGLAQTAAGFILFLRYIRCPHEVYRCCIITRWPSRGGISLGLFVFVDASLKNERYDMICAHEYGHVLQSLLLGPLYLPVIGLPSFIWCNLPALRNIRRRRSISYYWLYTERWADKLGGVGPRGSLQ